MRSKVRSEPAESWIVGIPSPPNSVTKLSPFPPIQNTADQDDETNAARERSETMGLPANSMSDFQMQRLGVVMEPEPGNRLEAEDILNPASGRGPDGQLYFDRRVANFRLCPWSGVIGSGDSLRASRSLWSRVREY